MQCELLRVTDVLTTCAVVTVRVQVKVSCVLSMAPLDLLSGHVNVRQPVEAVSCQSFYCWSTYGCFLSGQFSLSLHMSNAFKS